MAAGSLDWGAPDCTPWSLAASSSALVGGARPPPARAGACWNRPWGEYGWVLNGGEVVGSIPSERWGGGGGDDT